jgi:pilus assembly protein CpaC
MIRPQRLFRILLPAALAVSAFGQTHPADLVAPVGTGHSISLIVGRGQLLQFSSDIKQVAASEPKIADVIVISPREVMVNAKGPGRTTIVIWQGTPNPSRYEVDVLPDNYEFDQFREQLRTEFPGSDIEVTGKNETLVLTGTVTSSEQSKRAAGLAQSRSKTVVNLLKAPPEPELRQIMLQVKFAAIDRTALTQIGFNLFSRNNKLVGESSTEQFNSPRFSQLQSAAGNSSINFADLLNLFAYSPSLDIGATIKALQGQNILQVLAEPNLITLEGHEATFLAGGSFPFPVLTTTSTGGATSPVITVQFKPFGVQLGFTPTITPSGAIDLKVTPEVSSLDFSNAVTLQGTLIPALSQRKVDTEVILREGESFAIAGLIDNRVTEAVDKIIGLGNIPILGYFFKSRQTNKTATELLVVITPHIVHPLSPADKAKLPDMVIPFLKTVAEEKARKGKKSDTPKPEFVGPRGHQEPEPPKPE